MPWGAVASVAGGLLSSDASSNAADAQAKSSKEAIAEQQREYDISRSDLAPYRQVGSGAINKLGDLLGIGGGTGGTSGGQAAQPMSYEQWAAQQAPSAQPKYFSGIGSGASASTFANIANQWDMLHRSSLSANNATQSGYQQYLNQFNAQNPATTTTGTQSADFGSLLRPFSQTQFQADPGYQFRLAQGMEGVENSAAARGMQLSGNTLKGVDEFNQGFASNEYSNAYNRYNTDQSNIYNRLAGVAGTGQQAVNTGVAAGGNTANAISGLLTGAGNSQAAGIVGSANALGSGFSNAANIYSQQQTLGNLFGSGGGYTPMNTSAVDNSAFGTYG